MKELFLKFSKRMLLTLTLILGITMMSEAKSWNWENTVRIKDFNYVLNKATKTATICSGPCSDGELIIPSKVTHKGITYTVTEIADDGFYGEGDLILCYCGISGYVLPATIKHIGANAFRDCGNPKRLKIRAKTPPTLGGDISYLTNNEIYNVKLYVPKGSAKAYKSANGWKNFKRIIEF